MDSLVLLTMHYCTLTSDSVYHLPGDPGAEGFGGFGVMDTEKWLGWIWCG